MSWFYQGNELFGIPNGYVGFVYRISSGDRHYIGKKLFWTTITRPPLKGKKRKRREVTESDWLDYWGSNDELRGDVVALGKDKFHREILYLCHTKAEMSYAETKLIFLNDAILNDSYYNKWVSVRVNANQIRDMETHTRLRGLL